VLRQLGLIGHRAPPPCLGNSQAMLPMTTVVGIPPVFSSGTHAERGR
jgi:hypothetical protein